MVALHDAVALRERFMKFVPASGAASRMFIHWQNALANGSFEAEERGLTFAANLHKFAFFPELRAVVAGKGEDIETLLREGKFRRVLHFILTAEGLNYGHLPKALLKFHANDNGGSRTALEEHLVESILYTAGGRQSLAAPFYRFRGTSQSG